MQKLGLYLHIPFCRSKCYYCDFCSFPRPTAETIQAYARRLCADLISSSSQATDYSVDTVFFGGGTPTSIPTDTLCEILQTVYKYYNVEKDAEISLECNPATANATDFEKLRKEGFNRLSIGLQSVHQNELKALGRIHGFEDFKKTFFDARAAGFENVSADLMFGIPEQTTESYSESIRQVANLSPEHISAYGLIVEEGTPFYQRMDSLPLPDEETERTMFFSGISLLEELGYHQYEISNFAKVGKESRHNLKYWNCEPYLGFGLAAYSDFGGNRFGNSRNMSDYLAGKSILAESESPSKEERLNEYVMLRMRLTKGVVHKDFFARFGVPFQSRFPAERLQSYVDLGLMVSDPSHTAFTAKGFSVSNQILSDILDFSHGIPT